MEPIKIRNFINGEWVAESGVEHAPLFNPSTGQRIGEVPLSKPDTSRSAVAAAHEAYDGWRGLPIGKRAAYLFDLRQAMAEQKEDLAQAIAVDQAKHISEARGEVQRVIEIIETACGIPTLLQGETLENIAGNIVGRVVRQPLGVFCGVAPFNFPALVFGWFIPFAIGVGNTFVYKPSTQSPFFMQKMGDIFNAIGLPPGVVNIIHGNRTVVQPWYDDDKVSGVCLVGSTPTAKKMAEACGRGGKRSMLLGGAKNYLVVMDDAQEDVFIENFIHSCYGSAGQRCLAGSVVAVQEKVYEHMLEAMLQASQKVVYGSAMDPKVYMGPVISSQARDRIFEYIRIGRDEDGAGLILDGRRLELTDEIKDGYYVAPTIFRDCGPKMRIVQEEIFGPVVSVMKFTDLDEVLGQIRDQKFGNGSCIFTQSLYTAEKFINMADVGMVGVNVGIPAPHPYLPFGGIKDSHLGTDKVQGKDGIDFFTQNKIATVRFAPPSAESEKSHKAGEEKAGKAVCGSEIRSCVAS